MAVFLPHNQQIRAIPGEAITEMYIKTDTTKPAWFEAIIKLIANRTGLTIHWDHSYREQNNCSDYIGMYSNSLDKVYRGVMLKGQGSEEELCITLHRIT